MTWYPTAFLPPQYVDLNGQPYSGAVLKAYAAETSTPIPMATNFEGTTTALSFPLNASGYVVSSGSVIIPHVQEDFKIALYPTQAAADANTGALWVYDDVKISVSSNTAFYQAFSGDNLTTAFTLSSDLGTDEKTIQVFVDQGLREHTTNGVFASDTAWTKGAGWTISGGVATATGAISTDLSQTSAITLVQGLAYQVTYTATRSAGSVTINLGGTAGTARSSAATFTETIIAGATQLIDFSTSGFTGTIDNVSVKPTSSKGLEVQPPTAYTLNGTTLTFVTAPNSGTLNIQVFAPSLLIGSINALADAAALSETNAAASAALAAADVVLTHADVVLTHADVVLTHADVTSAAASAAQAVVAAGSASLGNIHALTAVATAVGDEVPFADVSNSNLASKTTWTLIFALYAGLTHSYTGAQIAGETTLTSTSNSIALDLSVNNDYKHTFTENTTLANPTNAVAGQSGAIRLTQHASSPKTLAYGSSYKFPGGTVPTVTATNSAADTLFYYVRSSTFIECNLVKGFA